MFYFHKTPWLLRKLYPHCLWKLPVEKGEKVLYLTFDDGPHPTITPFVLEELQRWNARATFFCIGKNVAAHPEVYRRILEEGHRTGNHTYNHLNGWKTPGDKYFRDIMETTKYVDSNLFRPPYGRISGFQVKLLKGLEAYKDTERRFEVIMWDVLSGDFDLSIDGERCALNVIGNARPGSIIVFHDSEKAFPRMKEALPKVLRYFTEKGFRFERIGLTAAED
ncbi:MAG: polysaccharide deacetylase family protein [Candidatus Pseudobacter hemicellulosilyticus]|uniref:Polysaccharide deacetylase family protein n=1 Tax=Candidatus Pseudobacter hemicellulosilyticus TaxID=3121375 RepID=A0AAJ5WY03_9BACT|nr:MAG: polysaccharide deacetylase family protein [Pseudobacter sp.]